MIDQPHSLTLRSPTPLDTESRMPESHERKPDKSLSNAVSPRATNEAFFGFFTTPSLGRGFKPDSEFAA